MRKKPDTEIKPTITFEQLVSMAEVPEIPQKYKTQIWRTAKVSREIKITEETEHFLNVLCLHFGLGKNDVITHAINLLFGEAVETMQPERLRLYEERLETLRLHRLEQKEAKQTRKLDAMHAAIKEIKKEDKAADSSFANRYATWSYRHDKATKVTPRKVRGA